MKNLLINLITFFSLYKFYITFDCPVNSIPTNDSTGCICEKKYIYEFNSTSNKFECTHELGKKEFETDDHLDFIQYESNSNEDSIMDYDSTTDEIICFEQTKNGVNITYEPATNDVFGNKFERITCIPNVTINNSNISKRRLQESVQDIIKKCNESSDIVSCQNLANKCSYLFFDKDPDNICEFINDNYENSVVPKLFPQGNPEEYIKGGSTEPIDGFEVTYDQRYQNLYVNQLELYVAIYYENGTFIDMSKLEDKFIFCSNSYNAASNFSMFGNDVLIDCQIDLNELKSKENYFYEIFLNNKLPSDENKVLIQIPILVDNYLFDGKFQNESNMENWTLINRMFLCHGDWYAQRIKFVVELINQNNKHNIYRPYFEIYYSNVTNDAVYVSFISEYKTDIKNFMKACLAFLIVCIILVLVIVIFRMIVWVQLNPKELTPESFSKSFLLTLLMKICKWWGLFSFWYCFILCAYWYFFFKLANRIYLLMPPLEEYKKYYRKFDIMFGIGFGMYMIFMILRIYFQVNFDIYFIDWEHEKELFKNNSGDEATTSKYRKYRGAWRLIHVANQFNALQKQRLTSLFFAFCWHIILYYKAHWDNRELQTPGVGLVYYGRVNYILRLFISTCIIFSALIIQYVIVRLLQNWIPLKKQEFIDLCFVSNISVFILDEKLHGFYIHGHNPANKADVNLNELLNYLNNAENIINPELDNNDNDVKSYVMYISYPMRTIYDGLFYIQNEALLAQNQGMDLQKFIKERKLGSIFKYLPEIEEKNFNMLSSYMNNQLRNKMDNVFKNKNVYIREKTFLQNILELPANNTQINITNAEEIILYKDEGLKFDDVFFSGMEWEWMMMDMFIYQFWTRILHNCEIGILLTYICDYFLYYIRAYLGEKNVSKKSVIDERFFS